MMTPEELRIGNLVFWKPDFSNSNVLIKVEITSVLQDKAGYIRSHLEHRVEPFEDDIVTRDISYASYKELIPIPLKEIILKKPDKRIRHPKWILYVHELQNWYYWANEKKELQIDE